MSLTTRTIPAISNGISLQPPILRSPDQTDDEVNTWGDIAVGLGRRPPTAHVADLGIDGVESAFIHHINRDLEERYIVVIADGEIRVFDAADGTEKTVTAPFGWGYLAGADAKAFRAITVADYTFIVNTAVTPELGAVGDDEDNTPPAYYNPGGALAWGISVGA